MFNAINSKKQGDIGLGAAIAWFAASGYTVCIPLTDSQDYDLIVELEDGLKKVQVRTTAYKVKSGKYAVGLRVCGGNRSWNGKPKTFDSSKVDFLFVLVVNKDQYLIPAAEIKIKNEMTLGGKWDIYKLR